MQGEFVFLAEKEEMWAQMLMEVLQDNGVSCTAMPVYGAAFALKTGKTEHLRVYVPAKEEEKAKELLEMLFSAAFVDEEMESGGC